MRLKFAMKIATDYVILRGIEANERACVPLERKPLRIATIIDGDLFERFPVLDHNETVFLEDRNHDWRHDNGQLRYYSRIAEKADVVAVFAQEEWKPGPRERAEYLLGLQGWRLDAPVVEAGKAPNKQEQVLTRRTNRHLDQPTIKSFPFPFFHDEIPEELRLTVNQLSRLRLNDDVNEYAALEIAALHETLAQEVRLAPGASTDEAEDATPVERPT